jgi:ketosteroid isomerase-like protein
MNSLLLATGVFLTIAAAGVFAADPKSDEQAVRAAVAQFDEAARKQDRATLDKLLSPDLVYVHSLGKVENKTECIDALMKSRIDFKMDPNPVVKMHGPTAIVHVKTTSHMMQDGKPTQIPLDMMQVWVKKGSSWQLAGRHTLRFATK